MLCWFQTGHIKERYYRRRCTVCDRTGIYPSDEDAGCTTGILFLVCGSMAIGDTKKLGTVGARTLVFYLATTALAVTVACLSEI